MRSPTKKAWCAAAGVSSSTYAQIVRAMRRSYELGEERGLHDPDMNFEKRKKPAFGNHSARRYCDKKAQRTKHLTLVAILGKDADECKVMIDYYFGWKLTEQVKDMQLAYAGRDEIDLAELAIVSLMI